MKKSVSGLLLVTAGMVAGAIISSGFASPTGKGALPLNEIRQFTDVYGAVKQYYVEPVEDKKLMREAISGMLHGLDPHSAFLDPESFKDLQEGTAGEFGGLGLEVSSDPSGVKVISPIDDTPAAKAGVRAGDVIFKIDGKLTRDLPLSDSVKMMRGKPGTSIELTIARKGESSPLTVKLKRAIIKVKSIKSKALDGGLGYIRISQFQERTGSDLAAALNDLHKSGNLNNGLILDLRNDPGGLLNAAIAVSAAFLPEGVLVVSTKGQMADAQKEYRAVPQDYRVISADDNIAKLPTTTKTVPIVVLVNGASASASEIVAGALQDHKRATILGTRSFGKGSVQTIIPLRGDAKDSAIKLTTARYFTPSGRSIQAKGIEPDVEVKDTAEGNFFDLDIREADLTNHLEIKEEKGTKKEPLPVKASDKVKENSKETPQTKASADTQEKQEKKAPKFYKYGDPEDYQLNKAIEYLKGKPQQAQDNTSKTKVIDLEGGIRMKVEPAKK